jgi:hypothetical protein
MLSILANAICSQLRALVALVVSRILYRTTPWSARQIFAIGLVTTGTFAFSTARKVPSTPPPRAIALDPVFGHDAKFDTPASDASL